ncbi:hypothetical protein FPQ18DRAFT_385236 [Pyronema domesticum]|nr:hypothetical protein FPQ18DRAFT_385236 [Pyronema domesticum]
MTSLPKSTIPAFTPDEIPQQILTLSLQLHADAQAAAKENAALKALNEELILQQEDEKRLLLGQLAAVHRQFSHEKDVNEARAQRNIELQKENLVLHRKAYDAWEQQDQDKRQLSQQLTVLRQKLGQQRAVAEANARENIELQNNNLEAWELILKCHAALEQQSEKNFQLTQQLTAVKEKLSQEQAVSTRNAQEIEQLKSMINAMINNGAT